VVSGFQGYLQKVQAQQAPGTSGIMLDFDSKNEDEFDMGFSASQLIQVTDGQSYITIGRLILIL
jgi:hypothetical protein